MICIGIDPGKNTGIAVWCTTRKEFLSLQTEDFWGCHNYVMEMNRIHKKVVVYIEDPRGNKPVFDRGQRGRKNLKIAQNVGGNKKEAGLLIEGFRRAGIPVQPVVPKQAKWDAKTFRNISKWKGRTNQHVRDAGRLVVGMREMPDAQYQQLLEQITETVK